MRIKQMGCRPQDGGEWGGEADSQTFNSCRNFFITLFEFLRGLAISLVLKIHEKVPFLDSLQVVVPAVQISVVAATLIIHGLLGLASSLSLWPQVVITIVAGIWCFVAITFLFQKGGLVNWGHEKALGTSFTEIVLFLVGAVYEIAGLEGDEILMLVVGVWVISFALFHF
jgi:hypothetical protein